jgi:hypothetical protein
VDDEVPQSAIVLLGRAIRRSPAGRRSARRDEVGDIAKTLPSAEAEDATVVVKRSKSGSEAMAEFPRAASPRSTLTLR